MSRPVPSGEYNKKLSTRIRKWVSGETDLYMGNVEVNPQKDEQPNQNMISEHKKDQDQVLQKVHDIKNHRIGHKCTSVLCLTQISSINLNFIQIKRRN